MTGSNIPSTPADGKIKTVLVPAIANTGGPTVAEATATSAVDISCYLTPGGFAFKIDQATITDERECDTITRNAPGRKTPTLEITGIDNTNSNDGATPTPADLPNDLAEALTEGSKWYAIRRRGVPYGQALAAGDVVTVIGFTVGVKSEVSAEANSVLRSTWATFVDALEVDVAITASA
ncbi:MAG: hypothetical protein FWF90_11390 [Promicromonosporaceae bacterium]|nr:hypothetical protein [Promicromonosporaceae bacterium]